MTDTEIEALMSNLHLSVEEWADSGRPLFNAWIRVTPTDCRLCATDDTWTDAKTVFRLRVPTFLEPFYLLRAIEKPRARKQFTKAVSILRKNNIKQKHIEEAGLIIGTFLAQTFEHQINFELLARQNSFQ